MASKTFYAIVAGVGPGTGSAVAKQFAKTYPVVLLARTEASYKDLVTDINKSGGKALGVSTDTSDPDSVKSAFDTIKKELGDAKLAAGVYNVGGSFVVKPFLEMSVQDFDAPLSANARGLFNFSKYAVPLLLDSVGSSPHSPSLIVTGATASLRAGAKFSGFATGCFAKRALAQSLAREFGPQGVHVAHVIVDGLINTPRTQAYADKVGGPEGMLSPQAIADAYWYLHTQDRSAFTQELDIRPFKEKF